MTAAGTTAQELPSAAAAVVIGAGVGGASIAYHLAELGLTDTVVVEQHDLGDGTTWHSAGFVGQLRSSISADPDDHVLDRALRATRRRDRPRPRLARRRRAADRDHPRAGRGAASPGRAPPPPTASSSTSSPPRRPTSGCRCSPSRTCSRRRGCRATATSTPSCWPRRWREGAARHGATFHTGVRVTGFELDGDRVVGVITDRGTIATETAVIAAGAASGALGRLAGASIPIVPMRHQYVVTEPFDPPVAPDVHDGPRSRLDQLLPSRGRRPARRRLLPRPGHLGRRRAAARPADVVRTRHGAVRRVLGGSAASGSRACAGPRSPRSSTAPRRSRPTASSSSARHPRSAGLWVAAGFCVHGLAGAGGVGRVIAEWIVEGHARVRRSLGDGHPALRRALRAAVPTRGSARSMPTRATTTSSIPARSGRPAGRCGCRRPTTASPPSMPASARRPAGSGSTGSTRTPPRAPGAIGPTAGPGRNWSPAIGAECIATRDAAGLFDQSSFAKLDIARPGSDGCSRSALRQRHRQAGRLRRLHAAAQRARRHRGRSDRHPGRRGVVPDRHRHRVRNP